MQILVCGAGSAGLLAALTLQHKRPESRVGILRHGSFPVIGVGESTFGSFPELLQTFTGIDFEAFRREVRPVTKYGLWLGFGPKDFHYSFQTTFDWKYHAKRYPEGFYVRDPIGHNDFSRNMLAGRGGLDRVDSAGVQVDNARLLAYLEQVCRMRGIPIHDEPIERIERDGDRITSVNGRSAEVFVDCTGFRAQLTQEDWVPFDDCLLNDRAIFLRRPIEAPPRPYTKATTLPNGWLWEIDHPEESGIGYVYSSRFASDDQAMEELEAQIGPVSDSRLIRFPTGTRKRHWVGNVVSIGNSDGFIEPLEATTLTIILRCASDVAEILANDFDRSSLVDAYNRNIDELYRNIRDFILIHFVFNDRLDTEYWRACRSLEAMISKGSISEFILDYYRRNGPSLIFLDRMYSKYNFFGVEGYYTMFKGLGLRSEADAIVDACSKARG